MHKLLMGIQIWHTILKFNLLSSKKSTQQVKTIVARVHVIKLCVWSYLENEILQYWHTNPPPTPPLGFPPLHRGSSVYIGSSNKRNYLSFHFFSLKFYQQNPLFSHRSAYFILCLIWARSKWTLGCKLN